jgi:hypothetical protein
LLKDNRPLTVHLAANYDFNKSFVPLSTFLFLLQRPRVEPPEESEDAACCRNKERERGGM